ncbi:hypothetical protein RI367_005187 [Sorochytrium milnesiophthora]
MTQTEMNPKPMKIKLSDMENVKLQLIPLKGGIQETPVEVDSQSLWATQPVLIVFLRRPGCLFCRNEAVQLRKRRKEIEEEYGVRMVAIVNQKLGAQDFATNFWRGETYFDHTMGLFKALGEGKVRRSNWSNLLSIPFWMRFLKVKIAGFDNTMAGDHSIRGGVMVLGSNAKGIAYRYAEKAVGVIAPIEDVVKACKMVSEGPRPHQATLQRSVKE